MKCSFQTHRVPGYGFKLPAPPLYFPQAASCLTANTWHLAAVQVTWYELIDLYQSLDGSSGGWDGGCPHLSLHSVVYVPLEHFARCLFARETWRTDVRTLLRPCQGSVKSEVGRCWLQLPGIPVWTRKMLRSKREKEKEWAWAFLWLPLLSQHRILETLRHQRERVPAAKSVVPS